MANDTSASCYSCLDVKTTSARIWRLAKGWDVVVEVTVVLLLTVMAGCCVCLCKHVSCFLILLKHAVMLQNYFFSLPSYLFYLKETVPWYVFRHQQSNEYRLEFFFLDVGEGGRGGG